MQKACKKWLRGFVMRRENLSVRKPEPTSIHQRAQGFNQAKLTELTMSCKVFCSLPKKTLGRSRQRTSSMLILVASQFVSRHRK